MDAPHDLEPPVFDESDVELLRREERPPVTAEQRILGELGALGLVRAGGRRRPWLRLAATAAAAAASLVVGLAIGRHQEAITVRSADDSRPSFLLLLRDPSSPAPAGGHEARVAEYTAWARQLNREGRLIDGGELAGGGAVLGAQEATGVSAVGGYFMIRAADLEEATAVAARCPHLKYGGAVEVRQLRN